MTKEKLFILKGDKQYSKKLVKTIELFDTSLLSLINGSKPQGIRKPSNEKIIKQLNQVLKLWNKLKPLYLKEKNSVSELTTIITQNSILLKEMNTMVLLAEKELEY